MTDLELIFSMLGEAATTEITRVDDAQGFHESKTAARKGGEVAGKARKDLEKKTGKRVVSSENYLNEPESRKRLKHEETSQYPFRDNARAPISPRRETIVVKVEKRSASGFPSTRSAASSASGMSRAAPS